MGYVLKYRAARPYQNYLRVTTPPPEGNLECQPNLSYGHAQRVKQYCLMLYVTFNSYGDVRTVPPIDLTSSKHLEVMICPRRLSLSLSLSFIFFYNFFWF